TRGVVALYHGEPILTNYCSTCGGRTAARDEVWDKPPLAYLKSVSDAGAGGYFCSTSRYFKWEETWNGAELLGILRENLRREYGLEVPDGAEFRDLKILERGSSGRVRRIALETDRGTFEAHGDRIRWVLGRPSGAGPLRSTLFDL